MNFQLSFFLKNFPLFRKNPKEFKNNQIELLQNEKNFVSILIVLKKKKNY